VEWEGIPGRRDGGGGWDGVGIMSSVFAAGKGG